MSLHQNINGHTVIAYLEEREYTLALLPGYKASPNSGVIVGLQTSADSAAVKPSKTSFSVSPVTPQSVIDDALADHHPSYVPSDTSRELLMVMCFGCFGGDTAALDACG